MSVVTCLVGPPHGLVSLPTAILATYPLNSKTRGTLEPTSIQSRLLFQALRALGVKSTEMLAPVLGCPSPASLLAPPLDKSCPHNHSSSSPAPTAKGIPQSPEDGRVSAHFPDSGFLACVGHQNFNQHLTFFRTPVFLLP